MKKKDICYSIAVTTIGVALSAVLLDIAPLFTLLFSVLIFQEKVTFVKGIAVIINIIGCILTVTNGKLELQSLALFGLLMGISAGFFYALIPTTIGYIFYYEGLKHITESSKISVIASMEVIVASLIGVVWYREYLADGRGGC